MIRSSIASAYKSLGLYSMMKIFKQISKRDILNEKENLNYQLKKLSDILNMAFSVIPYYKNMNLNIDTDNLSYLNFQKILT